MSVSDIVAIKRDGKVSCHYCDSFGFEQVPGFLPDNPLKKDVYKRQVLYHRTLNIGRVMSPTLALIVQRLSLIHI